jgi:hypothetical protein
MSVEHWTAVDQNQENVTFEVRNGESTRTEHLTLAQLAELLTQGGMPATPQRLAQIKLVSSPFPMRFAKTFESGGTFNIKLVQ